MHLMHRFIPHLRFDTLWQYQRRMPSGRTRWGTLPMGQDLREKADPQGAWLCVRRCVAVAVRQPWRSLRLPPGLPLFPEAGDVASCLSRLLPGWQVQRGEGSKQTMALCAKALAQGGSAMLRLELRSRDRTDICWAWVVGVEMQVKKTGRIDSRSLLIVPFYWFTPWACGYAARFRIGADGQCKLDGTDGQLTQCRCLAFIALTPPTPASP
ncbi:MULTISPECIES: hypothetical protein [unclassified Delftia]|uniref:hypothetical protein n=1 Tax=unclassified Delftia TaxID=2613839 RepID=UPI0018FF1994|nr:MULTISPECIES: hypothetical protein [unclassified Delftia]MBK0111682.1 hypothetical protein [Delftia sp. S65]MBK0118212.1 hypothetical protein [Delftia sp. S67]MBK0129615.1 hypothetical protein [Delftia sp. S66]